MAHQPTTVPADLTSFVGRRHDIAAVRQLLSTARAVTLTGMGGVGKTRLALRVSHDVRRAFPDGICLVDLGSLEDAALLVPTVMDALGIREQSTALPLSALSDFLRQRRMLLLIDNCEHLVDAVAGLADRLLRDAAELRILATSRQPLRIDGEYVYQVTPLPVPHADASIQPGTSTQYPSVELFIQRAEAVVPSFSITAANEASVVRLCQRLEGIPLAIELAAVRLRALTVDDILTRLDNRFEVLRQGNRNLPERQQTLLSLVGWSYDLCTTDEQQLWARAAVFAGTFDEDGLETVCADDELPVADILDAAAGLVEKSVFIREEQDQHIRFRMLETLRAYGHTHLGPTDEARLSRAHRDWVLGMVEATEEEWSGPGQHDWSTRLQLEHANLRRALEYSVTDPAEAGTALRMAGIPWFWLASGYMAEGRHWLDRVLALNQESTPARAWALDTAAYMAMAQGDVDSAAPLVDEAIAIANDLGDRAALAYSTHMLALRYSTRAEIDRSVPLFKKALELYIESGVPRPYSDLLRVDLASTYILLGEISEATTLVDELFASTKAAGEPWHLSWAIWERGWLRLVRGELDEAESDLIEALAIKRRFHDTLGLGFVLDVLGWCVVAKGEAERGATLLGAADSVWETIGLQLLGSAHLMARRTEYESAARRQLGDRRFETCRERGTRLTADEVRSVAAGEAPKAPQPGADAGDGPALTRRETEVARLVADGLANKEIAARLVISLRTAEGHVENILTKLGFTSRTQIAGWVHQHS